jgi:hypothetical protein
MFRPLTALMLIGTLTGCYATGVKVREDQLAQLQRGTSTYSEVVQALGPPTSTTLHGDGSRDAVYTYNQVQANPVNFIPIVGSFLGGATSEHSSVTLAFDPAGRLVQYSTTHGSETVGTGLSSGARQ